MRVRKRSLPAFFAIMIAREKRKLYVCKRLHHFVFYPHSERRKLAHIFNLDAIKLPLFSLLIEKSYMKHAGAEYLGPTSLRYHVYLFPNNITFHDSIIIAYNWSIGIAAPWEGNHLDKDAEDFRHEEVTVEEVIVQD